MHAFALLVFLPEDHPGVRIDLDANTASFVGEAEQLFENREHLGLFDSLSIGDRLRVADRGRLVLSSRDDPAPNVINSEAKTRSKWRVHWAWRAALLVESDTPLDGDGWIFTGTCAAEPGAGTPVLHDISGTSRESGVARPFFLSRREYNEGYRLRRPSIDRSSWHAEWIRFDRLLCDLVYGDRMPPILHVALIAEEVALSRHELGFRIPDLIRAAECVLALPRGSGSQLFAERALRIAPELRTHWYCGGSKIEDDLRQLYNRRSECVHGRIPFEDLQNAGEPGRDQAAHQEFLAMELARRCIVAALEDTSAHDAFRKGRAALEQAWAEDTFLRRR